MSIISDIEFWHWWVVAMVLLVVEILAPGAFFLWLGISAAVVGLILLLIPTVSWELQMVSFAVFSIASIVLWQFYKRKHPTPSEDENLNQRTRQYLGRIFTLQEPIVDGIGKIHVDDSQWRISGPDLGAGVKVKVVSADGATLIVEAFSG